VCQNRRQAEQIQKLFLDFGLDAKQVQRKKYYVVYIKEGENIADFLHVIEAHQALMEFENARIYKDVRNQVNRKVNCEAANINKTVKAATRQVEDIIFIRDKVGLATLAEGLEEIALLRIEYPEASLKELGEMLSPPVGKSGVNHRLKKLCEIAEGLRAKSI
jgi:DNA-binding protein WhiA